MSITRQYIFNKVTTLLKKETKFFTSSELNTIIGYDAFRRISEDIYFPKSNVSSFIASGNYLVSMPADFVKVDQAKDVVFRDNTGYRNLTPKTQKLIGTDNVLNAVPGMPDNYFMANQNTIGVYPPSTSGSISIPYISRPAELTSDSATNELTEMCYMAATYWTVRECMLKDNDQRYATYEQLYTAEIMRLRREYGEMYEEDKDMIPHEDYLR